jgi:hypothetical protein
MHWCCGVTFPNTFPGGRVRLFFTRRSSWITTTDFKLDSCEKKKILELLFKTFTRKIRKSFSYIVVHRRRAYWFSHATFAKTHRRSTNEYLPSSMTMCLCTSSLATYQFEPIYTEKVVSIGIFNCPDFNLLYLYSSPCGGDFSLWINGVGSNMHTLSS